MQHRDAEHGHDRVADELLDGAAVPLQDLPHRGEVARHERPHHLGVEPLAERRRPDHVREHDGHGLAHDPGAEGLCGRCGLRGRCRRCRRCGWDRDRRRRHVCCRRGERRVLPEDAHLERLEVGTRVDAQALIQRGPCRPVGGECLRLAARAVQREHTLRVQAFPVGVLGDERFEFACQCLVTTVREVSLDPGLDGADAQLLQPCHPRLRERLVREVRERRSPPQAERLAQQCARLPGRHSPRPLHERLEALHVHVACRHPQHIARRAGLDRRSTQQPAEARDVALEGGLRGGWRIVTPDQVDQSIDRDDRVAFEQQHRQDGARPRPAQVDRPPSTCAWSGPRMPYSTIAAA